MCIGLQATKKLASGLQKVDLQPCWGVQRAKSIPKATSYFWKWFVRYFPILDLFHICFFGHAETVPRHISRFQFFMFREVDIFEKRRNCRLEVTIFYPFQVSQPCASVAELPAALRRPQKKHVLDFVSMYFICVVTCSRFQCPLVFCFQIWPI